MNAACTGFVLAFNTAQAYISAGICKTVMVIGADSMSNLVDWTDRSTCILFGDGAGAVILRAEEGMPVHMAAHSDGVKGPALTELSRHRKDWDKENDSESYIHMDGQAVFKFAVRKVPEIIEEVLDQAGMRLDEVDHFVLHQANRRIIEAVAKRLKTDISKFPHEPGRICQHFGGDCADPAGRAEPEGCAQKRREGHALRFWGRAYMGGMPV